MFRPTPFSQNCGGLAALILACGASWSMVSGALVKGSIAGANFSVNDKLRAIERDLEQTQSDIDEAESKIESELEELANPEEM